MTENPPWTPRIVRLALAQFAMSTEPAENLKKAEKYILQAGKSAAQIVCLPELFRSPYFCKEPQSNRDYAESLPGEIVPALSAIAAEAQIALVAGSVYERTSSGELFNTALVFNQKGELLGDYRKVHIPHDPAFFEMNYFKSGNQGFKVFDLGFAKISVLICFDQWFPEAARCCALQGAEILFYPTAIGTSTDIPQYEGDWQQAWETVQRGHAVANSVVVAAVNRVGTEGKSQFWGGSFVSNGFGKILVRGDNAEGLLLSEVDLGHSSFSRESWRFMHSRQPQNYGRITQK